MRSIASNDQDLQLRETIAMASPLTTSSLDLIKDVQLRDYLISIQPRRSPDLDTE